LRFENPTQGRNFIQEEQRTKELSFVQKGLREMNKRLDEKLAKAAKNDRKF
jgi:hypothetical protein